jgi:hypothetical protein
MVATKTAKRQRNNRGGKRPGAGRKALPKGEVRDVRLMVRLTSAQSEILAMRAEGAGLAVADYVRMILRLA